MVQRVAQYQITRDIQEARGTPEHTYDDTRSIKPELLKSFGDSFTELTKTLVGKEKDLGPLSEAVKEMKETFLADQTQASKKDDYMNQLTRWAYKQGYDSSDISGVFNQYQISDVTEDVNKYLKQSSADAGEQARLAIEQGYKLDPTAKTAMEAEAAFNRNLARGYYLDAATNMYKMQEETDPEQATGTLGTLVPTFSAQISSDMNQFMKEMGGSASLTRNDIMKLSANQVQNMIRSGLPEWYATYVTDLAMYPYKKIADSAGEERVKATESLENYNKNLQTNAVVDLLNQVVKGNKDKKVQMRDLAAIKDSMGAEVLSNVIYADGTLDKNLITGRLSNEAIGEWQKDKIPQNEVASFTELNLKKEGALNRLLANGPAEVQQTITKLSLSQKSNIPAVSQAAIQQGQVAMNAAKQYNAAPDSSIATDKGAKDVVAERQQIQGTLEANAEEELRVFGTDKLVHVNEYGNASVINLDEEPTSATREQERELRRVETMMSKMQRQTEEPMAKLAQLHNDLAKRAHGITGDRDAGTAEWQAMTPEEQQEEMMKGDETPVKKQKEVKTPPVPPRKPTEIDESGSMMDFPSSEQRTVDLFLRR